MSNSYSWILGFLSLLSTHRCIVRVRVRIRCVRSFLVQWQSQSHVVTQVNLSLLAMPFQPSNLPTLLVLLSSPVSRSPFSPSSSRTRIMFIASHILTFSQSHILTSSHPHIPPASTSTFTVYIHMPYRL
ncbi:hypothetical protein K474DRAFT_981035 [Panus rudis PR-1116 ss-1]|nr:hypothetical protein K474DRAFT_981035 [Panus rudis PR-1116 ss-1]